jgi:hypothetical protein
MLSFTDGFMITAIIGAVIALVSIKDVMAGR